MSNEADNSELYAFTGDEKDNYKDYDYQGGDEFRFRLSRSSSPIPGKVTKF